MTAIQALANEKNNVENAILNIKKYTVGAEENAQFLKNVAPPINPGPNEDDIATIIDQTGCDKETAVNALKGENNDVISCIMNIDNYKVDSNQESEEGVTLSVSE